MTGKSKSDTSTGVSIPETLGLKLKSGASKRLLWREAVLLAIKDFLVGTDKRRLEVARWTLTEDFQIVCRAAGIDGQAVVRLLKSVIGFTLAQRLRVWDDIRLLNQRGKTRGTPPDTGLLPQGAGTD